MRQSLARDGVLGGCGLDLTRPFCTNNQLLLGGVCIAACLNDPKATANVNCHLAVMITSRELRAVLLCCR